MSRRGMLGLMGVLVLLAASTPTMAATNDAWSPPSNLSDWQGSVLDFRLELGRDGTQAALWLAQDGSGKWSLWARVRPPGGDWGPPENLSGWREYLAKLLPTFWDAGVDADGSAWALWVAVDSAQTGDNVLVMSARRPPDGSWQEVVLSGGYETAVRWADLHIGPDGHVAAAWVACASFTNSAQGPCHVRVRRRPAGAPAWLPVEHADETYSGEGISQADVLVGPGGLTAVLWLQADTSTPANWAVMARTFSPEPPPGTWDPSPVNLSDWKSYIKLPPPVIDPGGTVTVAWLTFSSDPAKRANYASTRSATAGAWSSPPTQISKARGGFSLYEPTLAVGQDGTVAAVWIYRAVPTESYLLANVRDPGSVWGGEVQVYGRANLMFGDVNLGVWPDGASIVLYSLIDPSHPKAEDELLRWSVRPPYGAWGDGGQGRLGEWTAGILGTALELGGDGSGTAVWGLEDASRPSGQEYSVVAATWPPGGRFGPPVQISDWYGFAWVRPTGLVVGREGWPVAAVWRAMRASPFNEAVFYSELGTGGHLVHLPLVLRRSP
jgi:hypothetical protein